MKTSILRKAITAIFGGSKSSGFIDANPARTSPQSATPALEIVHDADSPLRDFGQPGEAWRDRSMHPKAPKPECAAPTATPIRKENHDRIEAVNEMEGDCCADFFALLDLAAKYGSNPQGCFHRRTVIQTMASGLCQRIGKFFDKVRDKKTRKHLSDAIRNLSAVMDFATDMGDPDGSEANLRKEDQGRVLFMFVLSAATAMEAAGTVFTGRAFPEIGISNSKWEDF